jgi:hypothetical protein
MGDNWTFYPYVVINDHAFALVTGKIKKAIYLPIKNNFKKLAAPKTGWK